MSEKPPRNPLDALPRANLQPVPDTSAEARVDGERRLGLRCHGCGERMTVKGWRILRFDAVRDPVSMERAFLRQETFACGRDKCGYLARAAERATAVQPTTPWLFLDDERVRAVLGGGD